MTKADAPNDDGILSCGGIDEYEELKTQLHDKRQLVNKTLQYILDSQSAANKDMKEVLRYVIEAPGKRIRSSLVLFICELVSGRTSRNCHMAAAAVEIVHTYSLVHDDLPAMDNDDFRRGRPTCHKAFDEASAILAGDALLTMAFEVLAKEVDEPVLAVRLIRELAEAAGPAGMVAGQMADMKAEKNKGTIQMLEYIHTNKTAKLFRCAAAMGAVCGDAVKSYFNSLCEYGLKLGLGFQIADDILDVSASSEQLGKTAGKDTKGEKCTYPSVVGIKKARELAEQLAIDAVQLLGPFGLRADILRQLAMSLVHRKM